MPTPRPIDDRIRSGTYTVSSITSTYAVTALAVQSDQSSPLVDWVLDGRLIEPPRRARIVTLADGSARDDGFYTFQWGFSLMTDGMLSHWYSQVGLTSARYALVSVMTYTETSTAVYLNATIYKPVLAASQRIIGGWKDVAFRFDYGTVIT